MLTLDRLWCNSRWHAHHQNTGRWACRESCAQVPAIEEVQATFVAPHNMTCSCLLWAEDLDEARCSEGGGGGLLPALEALALLHGLQKVHAQG
jgi:hypothetical protein